MNRRFRNALKDAYDFPEASRKDEFFSRIEEKKKPVPFYISFLKYGSVPVTAAIALLIFAGFADFGNAKKEFVTETPVMTSLTESKPGTDSSADEADYTIDIQEEIEYEITSEAADIQDNSNAHEVPAVTTAPVYSWDISSNADDLQTNAPFVTTAKTTANTSITVTTATAATKTTSASTTKATTYTTAKATEKTTVNATTTINYEPSAPICPTTTTTYSYFATTTTESWSDAIDVNEGRDMRVSPPVIYEKTSNIIDITDVLSTDNSNDNENAIYSWKNDALNADAVLYGTIEDIYYTSISGMPYIQADILVEYSVQYENYYYGDRISVYIPGGYMSLSDFIDQFKWFGSELSGMTESEIAGSTAYYNNGNTKLIYEGAEYLFFLQEGFGDMPEGSLTLCSDLSFYITDGKTYTCAKDISISFTANELLNYLYKIQL